LGPIKKYLWNKKHKGKIDRCIHTVRLLQTLAALDLWEPSPEREVVLLARWFLHTTLKDMGEKLVENKLK
jgi:hypothetical protein